MRLGILSFGDRRTEENVLVDALRAAEIDVILADTPVTTTEEARQEAERLARADCDGVLLYLAPLAEPSLVGIAALLLAGTPLRLESAYPAAFLDAAGALAAMGVSFDHKGVSLHEGEELIAWLRENSRRERQRGHAAARKLYGQHLDTGSNAATVDAARWMHQFGIIVGPAGPDEATTFSAPDGDVCGALTRQLLRLLHPSAEEPVYDLVVGNKTQNFSIAESDVTVARIAARKGKYYCFLLKGKLNGSSFTLAVGPATLHENLLSSRLHAIAGDRIGAMRAACEALDIEPILLRESTPRAILVD